MNRKNNAPLPADLFQVFVDVPLKAAATGRHEKM
jgi:hypothetical protein